MMQTSHGFFQCVDHFSKYIDPSTPSSSRCRSARTPLRMTVGQVARYYKDPTDKHFLYANTWGSTSEKNASCRRETTLGTSASSITKLILISDAPWEIMRMLTSGIAPKTLAAMPGVLRMFSPTRQTIAFRPSYFASARRARSAAIAAIASFESTVTETLTSEVETMSTGQRWLANTSKILFRNPCAINMRVATTSATVIRFLAAIALKIFLVLGAVAVIRVPSHFGLDEFKMSTGIFFWMAGNRVAGCRTLAPKYASSAASSKVMVLMRRAWGQRLGSVVIMPSTSVQISMRCAFSPAPTM